MTSVISLYKKPWETKSTDTIPLDIFLENIRNGHWQDIVLPIRAIGDKKKRDEEKKKAPSVTLSGLFRERLDSELTQHSGYIGIDIDSVQDPEELKSLLCPDRYVFAAFRSISGRGLCLIFRINPEKHREAFNGICAYLLENYNVICDPTSINPSRARFVSFDPHIYINEEASKFTLYPKEKEPKRIDKVVFDASDFQQILQQITDRRLNITQDSYHIWLRLGFAIFDKFREEGREYFHLVSQNSVKYNPAITDKQYDAIKKANRSGVTISTFYYYAKESGCTIYTERTKTIIAVASQAKHNGLSAEQVAENLAKFEEITDSLDLVKQVIEQGIEPSDESLVEQFELWLRHNYKLKRNEITGKIEVDDKPVTDGFENAIFIKAKKIFDKLPAEWMKRVLFADSVTVPYNPIKDYFDGIALNAFEKPLLDLKNGHYLTPIDFVNVLKSHGKCVCALFDSISTKDSNYLLYFGAKWLVGILSAVYESHSPLMLVLCGEKQGTGKTEWFRRLLPTELQEYYAENKLDIDKDAEILMTQKLIIMDDEMGGKSKKEAKRLKELTSKQVFSIRRAYGRHNEDLRRLAVLCGTTNDLEVLSDPTGNRRIIPIQVNSIDHSLYNSIDKRRLWEEIYWLYSCGMRWQLTREDIEYLNSEEKEFEETSIEKELLVKYIEPGRVFATNTDIKVWIEKRTNQKLSSKRLGQELKNLGYERKVKGKVYGYYIEYTSDLSTESVPGIEFNTPEREPDDLPF